MTNEELTLCLRSIMCNVHNFAVDNLKYDSPQYWELCGYAQDIAKVIDKIKENETY